VRFRGLVRGRVRARSSADEFIITPKACLIIVIVIVIIVITHNSNIKNSTLVMVMMMIIVIFAPVVLSRILDFSRKSSKTPSRTSRLS